MSRCVILQSNYIPWKGYFHLIDKADIFVFYDVVQYTKRDWRNRNKIATPNGLTWLTIPVKADLSKAIDEIALPLGNWRVNHVETVRRNYSRAIFGKDATGILERRLSDDSILMLSQLNQLLIKDICQYLGIESKFIDARELNCVGSRAEKLLNICRSVGATRYLSGPAAKSYIGTEFDESEIELEWMEYGPYPEYPQLSEGPFEHGVSIIDLIAHTGLAAADHIW